MATSPGLLENAAGIELALTRVGEILEAEGEAYAIVVIGGAALNLLGLVSRTTRDVDILAFAENRTLLAPPDTMPPVLASAIEAVGARLNLPKEWLNVGPALQWKQGLPPALETRIIWRQYGALTVGLVDRYDLIFFKLYAAADSEGTKSRHYRDLITLAPTVEEVAAAAAWVRQQDASAAFASILDLVLTHVRRDIS